MKRKLFERRALGLAWLLPLVGLTLPAVAQDDMEWEADEGYHEEEWYDPSDWFNDDSQVAYEYDAWDAYEPYAYDESSDMNRYGNEWEYGRYYDYGNDQWSTGYHYAANSTDSDVGWYYDDQGDSWSYGEHYDEYEYYSDNWWE